MYSSVLLNKVRKVYLISDHINIDLDMKGSVWTLVTELCGSSFYPVFFFLWIMFLSIESCFDLPYISVTGWLKIADTDNPLYL